MSLTACGDKLQTLDLSKPEASYDPALFKCADWPEFPNPSLNTKESEVAAYLRADAFPAHQDCTATLDSVGRIVNK